MDREMDEGYEVVMRQRRYLGDGVYAELGDEGHLLELTTSDGAEATNKIILEPRVLAALVVYIETHFGKEDDE
jgi:hypothetical protein